MADHPHNPLSYTPGQQAKALIAAGIAALTRLQAVLPDGINFGEGLSVAVAGLVAYGAVFGVRNR